LAEDLGLQLSDIGSVESGDVGLSATLLVRFAARLSLPMHALFDCTDDREPAAHQGEMIAGSFGLDRGHSGPEPTCRLDPINDPEQIRLAARLQFLFNCVEKPELRARILALVEEIASTQ
jgi:hypothetical protein